MMIRIPKTKRRARTREKDPSKKKLLLQKKITKRKSFCLYEALSRFHKAILHVSYDLNFHNPPFHHNIVQNHLRMHIYIIMFQSHDPSLHSYKVEEEF